MSMPLFGIKDRARQSYVQDKDEHLERVHQELIALKELTREHADMVADKVDAITRLHHKR